MRIEDGIYFIKDYKFISNLAEKSKAPTFKEKSVENSTQLFKILLNDETDWLSIRWAANEINYIIEIDAFGTNPLLFGFRIDTNYSKQTVCRHSEQSKVSKGFWECF